jgi:hypothetical protein
MDLTNEEIQLILEGASVLISLGIAIAAIYGVKQIYLMKSDINTRAERASKEKAIDATNRYLTNYTKLIGSHTDECLEKDLPTGWNGEIGSFNSDSVDKKLGTKQIERIKLISWLPAINELESISAMFMTGVADEETGFKIIGFTFCSTVASNYDLIASTRSKNSVDYWDNIVGLYKVWSKRLERLDLTESKNKLEEKLQNISDERIPPLGPNLD